MTWVASFPSRRLVWIRSWALHILIPFPCLSVGSSPRSLLLGSNTISLVVPAMLPNPRFSLCAPFFCHAIVHESSRPSLFPNYHNLPPRLPFLSTPTQQTHLHPTLQPSFAFPPSAPFFLSFFPPRSTSKCPARSASSRSVFPVSPLVDFFLSFACAIRGAFLGLITRARWLGLLVWWVGLFIFVREGTKGEYGEVDLLFGGGRGFGGFFDGALGHLFFFGSGFGLEWVGFLEWDSLRTGGFAGGLVVRGCVCEVGRWDVNCRFAERRKKFGGEGLGLR